MREVLKWNKNHITGELIEKKVNKPDNGLIGKVKIEVFNDGNLKNETFTENIIPAPSIKGDSYRHMYHLLKGSGESKLLGGTSTLLSFSHIALGTNDIEENAENLWGNCGDIIGWCPRTNEAAGSDPTRGIYNKIESYEEYINGFYHAHMVYDFGTSQGNGTFNSVWWGKNVSRIETIKVPPFSLQQFRVLGPKRHYHQVNSGTYYYKCVNGSYYIKASDTDNKFKKLKNPDLYINGLEEAKYFEENIITNERYLPLAHYQFEDGSYVSLDNIEHRWDKPNNSISKFEIVHKNKENTDISRKSIDFKVDFKEVWDYLVSTTGGWEIEFNPNRIIKVLENGDVYIYMAWRRNYYSRINCNYYDSSTDSIKQSTDVSQGGLLGIYNVKSGEWTLRFSMSNIESMRISATPDIANIFGTIQVDDKVIAYSHSWGSSPFRIYTPNKSMPYRFDELRIQLGDLTNNGSDMGYWRIGCNIHGTLAFINYTKDYINATSYVMGDFEIRHGYSAHTKLPNPVTKTSADTMKIVYDYYIQVPKTIDKDEDYLTYRDIDGNPIENTIS
ncbi:MAG: hypothetical protein ACRCWG_10600 [Sarcina sp.]